jgi:hypothetical protein
MARSRCRLERVRSSPGGARPSGLGSDRQHPAYRRLSGVFRAAEPAWTGPCRCLAQRRRTPGEEYGSIGKTWARQADLLNTYPERCEERVHQEPSRLKPGEVVPVHVSGDFKDAEHA